MSEIKLDVDASGLLLLSEEITTRIKSKLEDIAQDVTKKTNSKIKELADARLKTNKEKFLKGIETTKVAPFTYEIKLDDALSYIETGLSPFNMLEKLLASPKAKTSKSGGKFLIVPFNHSKEAKQRTDYEEKLSVPLKSGLRKNKVTLRKLEYEDDGTTLKTGPLHRLNIDVPKKLAKKSDSVGRLDRLTVYQNALTDKENKPLLDTKGKQKGSRSLFTFRTASSSQLGSGRWSHPGVKPSFIMRDAEDYAIDEMFKQINDKLANDLGESE